MRNANVKNTVIVLSISMWIFLMPGSGFGQDDREAAFNKIRKEHAENISNAEFSDSGKLDSVSLDYNRKIIEHIKEQKKLSKDERDEIFFEVMGELAAERNETDKYWRNASSFLYDDEFWDFENMRNPDSLDARITKADAYILASEAYEQFFLTSINRTQKMLIARGLDKSFVNNVIKGIKEESSSKMEIFQPYMKSHLAYGNSIKDVLEFLKTNYEKWETNEEGIGYYEEEFGAEYTSRMEELVAKEEKVNELGRKLKNSYK